MLSFGQLKELFVETYKDWNEDKAPRLAAALSYYTIFSLAPLLIIAISLAGLIFGQDAAREQVMEQARAFIGADGAEAIGGLLEASNRPAAGIIGTIIGFVTLLFGAAGVFGQLKDAMNTIWEVAPKPNRGIWGMARDNFLSFTMVLAVGFLLLVSLLISTALNALGSFVAGDAFQNTILWQIVNFVVQAGVTFGLFALIFKELPDAEIAWRDVLLGAGFTTALFAIGRFLISFYLGQTATGSTFGAAGSLVVILVWIYFSAQIMFFGAEFTQVYARRYGSRIRPSANAVPATEEMRAEQGMPDPQVLAATAAVQEGKHPEAAAADAVERHQGGDERAATQPVSKRRRELHGEPAEEAPRERAVGQGYTPPQQQAAPAAQAGPEQPRDSKSGTVLAGATIFGILGVIARGAGKRKRR
jgi:membrane protein